MAEDLFELTIQHDIDWNAFQAFIYNMHVLSTSFFKTIWAFQNAKSAIIQFIAF